MDSYSRSDNYYSDKFNIKLIEDRKDSSTSDFDTLFMMKSQNTFFVWTKNRFYIFIIIGLLISNMLLVAFILLKSRQNIPVPEI